MKLIILLLLSVAALAGCGDSFPDAEMHLGLENKVRPFAVVVEPPEAAPGETVQVTLLAWAADPDELDATWRVALDYDLGLYEVDEIERNYRPVPAGLPTAAADGFVNQTFAWTVPDSALLLTSALPDVIDDPLLLALLAAAGLGDGAPVTRAEVDALLKALTPGDLALLPADTRDAVFAVVDRFACQVRLRGTLDAGRAVDVTRNLTIRHTARLQGANTNHNTRVTEFAVVALHRRDAVESDIDDPAVDRDRYPFVAGGVRLAERLEVPLHADWTYYLTLDYELESYDAPFEPGLTVTEGRSRRWYYRRQDQPQSAHQFFVTDSGNEAEMVDLDDRPRVDPDGVGSVFRVIAAARDLREDWVAFHAVPGTGISEGVIEFVQP